MSTQPNLLASISPPPKSKAAILKELLPGIDGALAAGHAHLAIYEHIKASICPGINYRYYQLALQRARQSVKESTSKTQGVAPASRPPSSNSMGISAARIGSDHYKSDPPRKFTYDLHSNLDDFFAPRETSNEYDPIL